MYYLTLVLFHPLGSFIHLQTLDLKPFNTPEKNPAESKEPLP